MSDRLRIPLDATPEQFERLRALQVAFAEVCNAIAPVVQRSRCWNRVALHHLVYRSMRERFPALGSQMICNAIYSVSRTARLVLQHPDSPWNIDKRPGAPLPLLQFDPSAPVYFDRHTLSLKGGVLSMFTLDGRMRFLLRLAPTDEARFHQEKLLEIVLSATPTGFSLTFRFANPAANDEIREMSAQGLLPEYIRVDPPETADAIPIPTPAAAPPLRPSPDPSAGP